MNIRNYNIIQILEKRKINPVKMVLYNILVIFHELKYKNISSLLNIIIRSE